MKLTSLEIIKKLRNAGFEAYWAGGCVRDLLLGIKPKDFDIVTSAKPEQIENLLEKTIPIGKQFGVILTIENGHHFEIATFRSDSGYTDGRRPDAVEFTTAEQDAQRRDFTINGLFYDPLTDQVLDFVEGQKDLEAQLIRFIGDPKRRIEEDHLRILRAVRFKNQLNFQYEPNTYKALNENSSLVIHKVSQERIAAELNAMLLTPKPSNALSDLEDLQILKIILPELQALKGLAQPVKYHEEGDVWNHTMGALDSLTSDTPLSVRWATLLHDIGKYQTFELKERIRYDHHAEVSSQISREILMRLKQPKALIDQVIWLTKNHMIMGQLLEMSLGKKRNWFLHPWFLHLLQVMKADIAGTIPADYSLYEKILAEYRETLNLHPEKPKPLLDGNEIMELLNLRPGKELGNIVEMLMEHQLAGEIKTKEDAKKWLEKIEK